MPFTDIFGGNTIYPSSPTYLALALAADTVLEWPIEQAITGDVLAAIIDVTPSGPGLSVILPDATLGSTGYVSTFYNAGASTFTVKNTAGGTVLTVASGEAWNIYLRDNTTSAGAWRIFQMGAGASSADAAALAGAGLVAITTTLNEEMEVSSHNADYVIVDGDRAKIITWTGGSGNLTLPDPTAVGTNWFVAIKNNGTGSVTVLPTAGNIDGSASLILATEESSFFVSNGTNFMTVGFGQEINSIFDFISIPVGGTGDFTLTGAQLNRVSYKFTGVLTGNRNIIVPASVQQYWIDNSTTGAFTLTVKTAAVAGVPVPQGTRVILYCDGTAVVDAETNGATLPAVVQGDMLYGTSPGTMAALAKSASLYQVLRNNGASNNPAWGAPPFLAAKVSRIGTQAAADGAPTTVAWNTEIIDDGNWHDNVTNNTRLTVPAGISRYRFEASIIINLATANVPFTVQAYALINGGGGNSPVYQKYFSALPGASLSISMEVSTGWESCIAGDYIEVQIVVDGAGAGGTIQSTSIASIEGRA